MDGNTELESVRQKIHSGFLLTDDDLMKLVVLPLSVPGSEKKTQLFDEISSLAGKIPDEEQRAFVLSAMTLAADRFIN